MDSPTNDDGAADGAPSRGALPREDLSRMSKAGKLAIAKLLTDAGRARDAWCREVDRDVRSADLEDWIYRFRHLR